MTSDQIANGLLQYLMLIVLLTFHEYGHAWVALKCGDDTAQRMGRVSLNPLVHMDLVGTVIIPLLAIFSPYGGFLIGGAKPVPVNPYNLRNPNRDDLLVTLAGPGMNLLLGILLVGVARALVGLGFYEVARLMDQMAFLSLVLCCFNLLLPIPPLDGSQVLRVLVGMSHETYAKLAQLGFIPLLLIWQVPFVQYFIRATTLGVHEVICRCFGL